MSEPHNRPRCARDRCDYVAKCRGLCAKHYRTWLRERVARGEFIPGYIDGTEVRAHLAVLTASGLSLKVLGPLTGLHPDRLADITGAKYGTVAADHVRRILTIEPCTVPHDPRVAAGHRINSIGTSRRLQALVAIGWTGRELAAMLGQQETNLTAWVHGKTPWITAGNARRVIAVYDRLQWTTGGKAAPDRARRRAARNGWVGPLAWDDDTIDDPAATPFDVAADTPYRRGEFLAVIEDHRSLGRSDEEIADRLGIHTNSLQQRLRRLALADNDSDEQKAC